MRTTVRAVVALGMVLAAFAPLGSAAAAAGITISPNSGAIGTTASVSGSGFVASTTVQIFFDGADGALVGAEASDASGNLPPLNVVIPDVTGGTYQIFATDGTNSATTTFTVPSSLTLSPSSGTPGTTVNVNGSGFLSGEGIVVGWNNASREVAAATANTSGAFTASFAVPSSSRNGDHQVIATGQSSGFATTAIFSVSGGSNPPPTLTLDPTSGPRGSSISVTGSGFGASEQVNVAVDDSNVTSTNTDASGNFSTSITAASTLSNGAHTISATGVTSGKTASDTFTITNAQGQSPCPDDANTRPGNGNGDKNHCHTGPPGHQGDVDQGDQGNHGNHGNHGNGKHGNGNHGDDGDD